MLDTGIKRSKRRLLSLSDEESEILDSSKFEAVADDSITSDGNSLKIRKRRRLEKSKEDSIPLPNPYPLPKHYRRDVEEALKRKALTKDTHSHFLSTVASSMFAFKRYPTSEDYKNVTKAIVQKYSFFKSSVGTPTVSLFNYFATLVSSLNY